MTIKEIYEKLVNPILALDEYISLSNCDSTIVVTIGTELCRILKEIEQEAYYNKGNE